ncbi:hypothetical protein D3C86_1041880 [compost metagenome]
MAWKISSPFSMPSSVSEGAGVSSTPSCARQASRISSRTRCASVVSGMGRRISTRPSALASVMLRTVLVMNSEFGTISVERSPSWISVARTLMRRTSPSVVPSTTQSPTFTGCSASRISPEMKFCTMACRPKPMPTDSALATHAMRSMPMPSADSENATTRMPPT